jgi:hypothetical protein
MHRFSSRTEIVVRVARPALLIHCQGGAGGFNRRSKGPAALQSNEVRHAETLMKFSISKSSSEADMSYSCSMSNTKIGRHNEVQHPFFDQIVFWSI